MEQVSALSMNPGSTPGSPRVSPADNVAAKKEKEVDTDTSSLASTSTITPDTASTPKEVAGGETSGAGSAAVATPSAELKTARERALAGLDKNNFETEVHQVMGTLNSWWGGVKKQVRHRIVHYSVRCDLTSPVYLGTTELEGGYGQGGTTGSSGLGAPQDDQYRDCSKRPKGRYDAH
jgi:hypothetical protein